MHNTKTNGQSTITGPETVPKAVKLQFGSHKIPFNIAEEELSLSVIKSKDGLVYSRTFRDEKMEKVLVTNAKNMLITPVEPINIPRQITQYFIVELEQPIVIEPKRAKDIFLTFPIELGVFITEKNSSKLVDVFSFVRNKYSLYGTPKTGVVCRYWKSKVFTDIPILTPLQEGVLKLNVTNNANGWVQLNKVVFYGYGMEIYYSRDIVSMVCSLKILNEQLAETDVIDSPLKKGMWRALETLPLKFLPLPEKKFIMGEGV